MSHQKLSLFGKIKKALWGELSGDEAKKFGMLSLTFIMIIGTYWLMRPVKDGIFVKMVGKLFIPYAKMLSFAFIVPLVLIYSKLVDLVEKQKLFYVICTTYGILFAVVAVLLNHPTIGMANNVPSKGRILGWVVYLAIESFGSLTVALFWSFVISSTETASAKRGFPLIILGGQIGAIAGPFIATQAEFLSMPILAGIVSGGILIVPLLIRSFIKMFPATAETHSEFAHQKKTGPIEGLKLLLTRPYLIGVLGIATLYEIVGTILDYQMKFLGDEVYHSAEAYTKFLGYFGLASNSLAFLFALIGTSFFIRRYGLTFCLVMYPTCVAIVMFNVWSFPTLWVVFGGMIVIKGLSYALNNPCKDMMYIPTSKDAKFKAKSWIDMFGTRSAKAAGSGVNAFFTTMSSLMFFGPMISMGIIGIWIFAALYVGRTNKHLTDTGKIIS